MQLETYDMCQGCGKSNVVGKAGLCFWCYIHRDAGKIKKLMASARFAKTWLENNLKHKNFLTALYRYEQIVDELVPLGGMEF